MKLLKPNSMIFILFTIVLFILYLIFINSSKSYAFSPHNKSRLTIIETGDVPSNAGIGGWEYTLYSIEMPHGRARYYIEYHNSKNKDVEIEQIDY